MADFQLYWNPLKPYATTEEQQVEYKKRNDLAYTVAATLPDYRDHYTVTGLQDNVVYDFRIATPSDCDNGNLHYTPVVSFTRFTCPVVTTDRSDDLLSFSLTPVDIDTYKVVLYQDGLYHDVRVFEGPFFADITGNFTGLNAQSTYVLRTEMIRANMSALCNNGQVAITCTNILDITTL